MLEGKRVAVVVPAHDEEKLIGQTVRGIPEFVDRIYVVDDCSNDATVELARALPIRGFR
jgi:glycosyltransferase involved in cell wall biosynthesis